MTVLFTTCAVLCLTAPLVSAGNKVKKRVSVLESKVSQIAGSVKEIKVVGDTYKARLSEVETIVDRLEKDSCHTKGYALNCNDIYLENPDVVSGLYYIYNSFGEEIEVYCDFYGTRGYMFLSRGALSKLDSLESLYSVKDHAVVRIRYNNGEQHQVKLAQLVEYQFQYALSFQHSKADGYQLPLNHAMHPYLYLGFLPTDIASVKPRFSNAKPIQGYNVNGRDFTFENCDMNPNSYIAFYSNEGNVEEHPHHTRCCDFPLTRAWFENDKPVLPSRYVPESYFLFFEMHMGGCGGYFTSSHGKKYEIAGATVGLGFDIKPRC